MKKLPGTFIITLFFLINHAGAQMQFRNLPLQGYDQRIKDFIDTLRVADSHEHLIDPVILKQSNLLDFMLLLHQFNYNDFVSSGLSETHIEELWSIDKSPEEKWKIIKPYWESSFNTTFNRITLLSISRLYGIEELNESTVGPLSKKIREAYQTNWFNKVLNDFCRIDHIVQDGEYHVNNFDRISYVKRFTSWLTVRSKYRIDSIAIMQNVYPISTLNDYVLSMERAFKEAVEKGVVAVKINLAYSRTLNFENPSAEAARKVFQSLIKGAESFSLPFKDVKPLQDYMFHKLMSLARTYKLPVVIHTGMQSGNADNNIMNSDPALLSGVFNQYPEIEFALYHGSYPYGGKLATLAKNFPNVYIDMSWVYSISPSYSESFLHEWLETVPVNKIMAFGGDMRCVENIYGELLTAKNIISKVLISKVKDGYFTEDEAKVIARMILHDNVVGFYNLH
jgi:predicted TIM-barrel fold metal-dependent hydrolase